MHPPGSNRYLVGVLAASWLLGAGCERQTHELKATLPAGTTLVIRLDDALDTGRNRGGDVVLGHTAEALFVNNAMVVPMGTTVRGSLSDVQRSGCVEEHVEEHVGERAVDHVGERAVDHVEERVVERAQKRPERREHGHASMTIRFHEIEIADQGPLPIDVQPLHLVARFDVPDNLLMTTGGDEVGRAVGAAAGGAGGAAIGGAIELDTGTAGVLATQGGDIHLASGQRIVVRLERSVDLLVQPRSFDLGQDHGGLGQDHGGLGQDHGTAVGRDDPIADSR